MDPTPRTPKAAWLDRFATRVGALLEGTTPQVAYSYAEDTFAEASDLSPEEAADIFAQNTPPPEPGYPDE